jgi:hypothetical protein
VRRVDRSQQLAHSPAGISPVSSKHIQDAFGDRCRRQRAGSVAMKMGIARLPRAAA